MVRQLRTPASSLFQKSRQDDADTPVSPASASQKPKSGWGDYELGTNSAIVDLRLRLASDSESRKSIGFGERIGEKIGEVLPGFRYSAAFLSTLRANLALTTALPPDSPITTSTTPSMSPPQSLSSSATLAPSSPLPTDAEPSSTATDHTSTPEDPLANIPPLTTYVTTDPSEIIQALKLVADSVAQRRQTGASMVIFHPYTLSFAVVLFAVVARLLYNGPDTIGLIATTSAGILMTLLLAVRALVGGYLVLAEKINLEWLEDDEMVVSKFGAEIIGTVVFRVVKEGGRKKKGKGVLRAWTVRRRERGRGVGRGLLEEVVQVLLGRGVEGIVFDDNHAHSKRVLPVVYDAPYARDDKRARKVLEDVVAEQGGGPRRNR